MGNWMVISKYVNFIQRNAHGSQLMICRLQLQQFLERDTTVKVVAPCAGSSVEYLGWKYPMLPYCAGERQEKNIVEEVNNSISGRSVVIHTDSTQLSSLLEKTVGKLSSKAQGSWEGK